MFVANATRLDSRRVDEAMRGHRRRGATQKTGVSRRNPLGGAGLRAISSSLLVDDAAASPPPRFSTSPPKPPPQTSPYLWKGALSTLEPKYCTVCKRGLRGEIKAGGGSRCLCIFEDDQRRDRPQPSSALRVATGRADFFVAPPPLWQGMAFVVASRTRPVALATNVAVFMFQCT